MHLDVLAVRARLQVLDDVGDFLAQLHLVQVHDDLAAFEPGDGEQILNQISKAVGVLFNGAEETRGEFGIVFRAVEEGFDETLDERERRAQFVADVGDKFLAGALQLLDARQIVEHENGTVLRAGAVEYCRRIDLQPAAIDAGQFKFVPLHDAFLRETPGQLSQFTGG